MLAGSAASNSSRGVAALGVQVQDDAARLVVEAKFETGLARDVLQKLGSSSRRRSLFAPPSAPAY